MITKRIADIRNYFEYLQKEHGDRVVFRNFQIPLEGYYGYLAPHYINMTPFCIQVKTSEAAFRQCIDHQRKLEKYCKTGPFCGCCPAGMGEFIFPIESPDGKILGFLSATGYQIQPASAKEKMKHFAAKYGFDGETLKAIYEKSCDASLPDIETLRVRIQPLCEMFAALYLELISSPEQLRTGGNNDVVSKAVSFLEKNYTAPITEKDLAKECNCSVSSLSHQFKQATGKSIPCYLHGLRIESAKRLLLSSDFTSAQISDALGFCNPNYFSNVFKKMVGVSPREFKGK